MKKQIKVQSLLIWGLVFMFFIPGNDAQGQIPQTLSYQGVLTDASGNAVADGNYKLTFRLYSDASNNMLLWEEVHQDRAIQNGVFNVILGSMTTLDLPFDQVYYLGIRSMTTPSWPRALS